MKYSAAGPAILLSPHLDDAVLSCWHLLEDRQSNLAVVTVFAGLPLEGRRGTYDERCWNEFEELRSLLAPDWDSRAVMLQRLDEDSSALSPTGRKPVRLGLFDSQYASFADTPVQDSACLENELAKHFDGCSALYLPRAAPPVWAEFGQPHIDHEHVREWGEEIAGGEVPVAYYADLPYAFRETGTDWVSELDVNGAGRVTLSDQAVADKLAAMRLYVTQWPVLVRDWRELGHIDLEAPESWRYEACELAG